jgi:hypothetical protein
MFKFIVTILILGFLFRALAKYILPIVRIASTADERMRQMQAQVKEMERRSASNNPARSKGKKEGDYIDYEEVR